MGWWYMPLVHCVTLWGVLRVVESSPEKVDIQKETRTDIMEDKQEERMREEERQWEKDNEEKGKGEEQKESATVGKNEKIDNQKRWNKSQ